MKTPLLFQTVFQQIVAWSESARKFTETIQAQIVLSSESFRGGWLRDNFTGRGTAGDTDFMTLLFILQHARPLLGEDLQRLMALGLACPADEGRLFARVTDVGLADEMGKDRRTVAASTDRLEAHGLLQVLKVEPRSFRDSKGQYAGSKLYLLRAELRQHTDLLARSGYAVTAGTLTSMTDLLRLYPPDVLQAALQEAVLYRVSDPLAYARKTLQDWAANGRPTPPTAPAAVIVDADLAQPAHILGLAGIDLTERVHAQLRLLADDCQAAAEQVGESGAIWLAAALTQSLSKHNPLDYAAAILANWQKNGRPQPKAAPAQPQTPGTPRNGCTHLTKAQRSALGVAQAAARTA